MAAEAQVPGGRDPDGLSDQEAYSEDGSFSGKNGDAPTTEEALDLQDQVEQSARQQKGDAFVRNDRGRFEAREEAPSFSLQTSLGSPATTDGRPITLSQASALDDTLAGILQGAKADTRTGDFFGLTVVPGIQGTPGSKALPGEPPLSAQFYTPKDFYSTTSRNHVPLTTSLSESILARQTGIEIFLGKRIDNGIELVSPLEFEKEVIRIASLGGDNDEAALLSFLNSMSDFLEDARGTLHALGVQIADIGRGKNTDLYEDPASHADVVAKTIAVYFARAHRQDTVSKVVAVLKYASHAQKLGLAEGLIKFVALGPLQGDMIDKALTDLVDLHVRLSQIESGADAVTMYHSPKTLFDAQQVDVESSEFAEANGNIVSTLRGVSLGLPSTDDKGKTTFDLLTQLGARSPGELECVTSSCFWQMTENGDETPGSTANITDGKKKPGASQADGAAAVLRRITIGKDSEKEFSTSDQIKWEDIIHRITARAEEVSEGRDPGNLLAKLAHQFHLAGFAEAETSDMFVQTYSYILTGNPTAVALNDNVIDFKKLAYSHRVGNCATISNQSLVRIRIGAHVRENRISKAASDGIELNTGGVGDASAAPTTGNPGVSTLPELCTDPQAAVINELEAAFTISAAVLQNAADADGEVVMDHGHARLTSEMRAASEGFVKVIRSIYASIHEGTDATMVREYKNSTVVQNGRSKEILDVIDAYVKAMEKHEDLDLSELGELPGIIASRDDDGKELNPALQLYPSLSSAFTTVCDPNMVMTVKSEPLALAPFQIFNFLKSSYALPPGRREAALTLIKLQLLGLTDISNLTIDDMSSLAREIEMWAASAGIDWEGPGIAKTLGAVFDSARVGKQDRVIPLVAKKEHLMGIWLETIIREGHVSRYGALLQEIFPADWVQRNIEQNTLTPQMCHSRWNKMWKGKYPAQKNEACEIDSVASSDKLESLKRKLPWQIRARNYGKSATNYVGLIAKDMRGRSNSGGSESDTESSEKGKRKKSSARRRKVLRTEIGIDPGLKSLVNVTYALQAAAQSDLDAIASIGDPVSQFKALGGWISSFTNHVKSNKAKAEEYILAPLRALVTKNGGSKTLANSLSLVERIWTPKGKAAKAQSSYFLCVSDQQARNEILYDMDDSTHRKAWAELSVHMQAIVSFLVDFGLKTSDRVYGSSPLLRRIVKYAVTEDSGSGICGKAIDSQEVKDWVRANFRTAFVTSKKSRSRNGRMRRTSGSHVHAAISIDHKIAAMGDDEGDEDDGAETDSPGDVSHSDGSESSGSTDNDSFRDKPVHPKGKKKSKNSAAKKAHRARIEAQRDAAHIKVQMQEHEEVVQQQSAAAAELAAATVLLGNGTIDKDEFMRIHLRKTGLDRQSKEISAYLAMEADSSGTSGENN